MHTGTDQPVSVILALCDNQRSNDSSEVGDLSHIERPVFDGNRSSHPLVVMLELDLLLALNATVTAPLAVRRRRLFSTTFHVCPLGPLPHIRAQTSSTSSLICSGYIIDRRPPSDVNLYVHRSGMTFGLSR